MRSACVCLIVGLAVLAPFTLHGEEGAALAPGHTRIEREWHRCLREAFAGQPESVGRQAAERAALAACKRQEDAVVASEIAARRTEGHERAEPGSLTRRAHDWMVSVAAYVVDPVTSWIGALTK